MNENMSTNPEQYNVETLWNANHSRKAFERTLEYEEARSKGDITDIHGCIDARTKALWKTRNIWNTASIAAASDPEEFKHAHSHHAAGRILVANHFDSETLPDFDLDLTSETSIPFGCGGLRAFFEMRQETNSSSRTGLRRYIVSEIATSDPVLQTLETAKKIVHHTVDKPVYMSVIDHITGQMYIIGVIIRSPHQKPRIYSPIDFNKYDPKTVYSREGIPQIDINDAPDESVAKNIDYLRDENAAQLTWINKEIPDFSARQKVQNPKVLHIGTLLPSLRVRYPNIFELPNMVVSIRMPKTKKGSEVVAVNSPIALAQAEYVIKHSAHAKPGQAFYDTRTILIETENVNLSAMVAQQLFQLPDMLPWIEQGGKIIVAETLPRRKHPTQPGMISVMEQFHP